ncbi:MAG: hypothetical protein SWQ30_20855 [Thermodesulfobacteriota bacterium]|nr:hypothetical protein [Thermodesulfobacteriota bacterium]
MQKIVTLTSGAEPNEALWGWLHRLFPKCETEMISRGAETFDQGGADCSYERFLTATTGRA